MPITLRLAAALCTVPLVAAASGNLIYYNGKKFDDRYGKPEHFTGEYSMRDMDTGKPTLVESWIDGVPDGAFTKYDARTGKVEETGSHRGGKLAGTLKRYDAQGEQFLEYTYG